MEHCKTKQELIHFYSNNYSPEFYKPWIKLSITKLTGFNNWTEGNLTPSQISSFKDLVVDNNFNKDHFLSALNQLTFKQISYVGW
jgi:hypothetical protein